VKLVILANGMFVVGGSHDRLAKKALTFTGE
jgi:hypothetical protein